MGEEIDRVALADRARRKATVGALSLLLTPLTVLAVVFMMALDAPPMTTLANALATIGFAIPFFVARRGHITAAATMLLATMLLQHVGSTLGTPILHDRGLTMMFSGLVPLIAAAVFAPRGTAVATAAAATAVAVAWMLALNEGVNATEAGKAFGPAMFFAMVGGVVAITWSLASRRALSAHRKEASAGAIARDEADEAKDRLRSIADQVSDLIAVLDAEGRYVFASASYERVLGIDPVSLVGTATPEIVHPEDLPAFRAAFQASFEGDAKELKGRLRTKDGTFRTFHVRLVGVSIDHARHVVTTSRDVTELEKLNAALEGSRRMESLGRLAGGVAHDFNNLLAVIRSCTAIIRLEREKPYDPAGELEVIDETVKRANDLTRQLLSFAQREVTEAESASKPYDVLERMLPLLERAVGKSVKVSTELRGSSKTAQVAEGQLEQLFLNLSVNARDAMGDGGTLTIRVDHRRVETGQIQALAAGVYCVITVIDDGTGMPADVAARVFEPFFTTKASGKGTGLGLATCFGIARQLGGTMTVDSEVGVGTTFHTYLPCLEGDAGTAPGLSIRPPKAVSDRTLSILVIDDEPMVRRVVTRALTVRGHQVTAAATAAEAKSQAEERLFDVIIADLVLGHDDGLVLLAELAGIQPEAGLLIMSGQAPNREHFDALGHADVAVLSKPFTMDGLLEIVLQAAGRGPNTAEAEAPPAGRPAGN